MNPADQHFDFDVLIADLLRGILTESQTARLASMGTGAVLLVFIVAYQRIAQLNIAKKGVAQNEAKPASGARNFKEILSTD